MGRSQSLQRLPQLGFAQGFHQPRAGRGRFLLRNQKGASPMGNLFSLALLGEREWGAPKGYSVSPSLALPRAFTTARAAA